MAQSRESMLRLCRFSLSVPASDFLSSRIGFFSEAQDALESAQKMN
jgi:hypothetical protein